MGHDLWAKLLLVYFLFEQSDLLLFMFTLRVILHAA